MAGSYNGYVALRRGIIEHLRDGRLTPTEFTVYVFMILAADKDSGIWVGSGKAVAGNLCVSNSTAHHALCSLETKGYIRRFTTPGRHGNYPILIDKYVVKQNGEEPVRLNAVESTDWRNPLYDSCKDGGKQVVKHVSEHLVEQVVPKQEREEEREKTGPPISKARDYAFESWRGRFGAKPNWTDSDWTQIAALFRRLPGLELTEFQRRWDNYMASDEPFIQKQGWSLSYFCSKFDSFMRGSVGAHGVSRQTGSIERIAAKRTMDEEARMAYEKYGVNI